MDTLGLSKEEIRNMNFFDFKTALSYSWTKFNAQRSDLILKQIFASDGRETTVIQNEKVKKLRKEEKRKKRNE